VTLTHVCGTNSRNWWAKGLPGVGVVKIFCDSDSSGWKSFRLLDSDSDSTALIKEQRHNEIASTGNAQMMFQMLHTTGVYGAFPNTEEALRIYLSLMVKNCSGNALFRN